MPLSHRIRDNRALGGGGVNTPFMVRRDMPEIILPTLNTPAVQIAGAANVYPGAYATLCTAVQFGAANLIMTGFLTTYRVGQAVAANLVQVPISRLGRAEWATGNAGVEIAQGEYAYGGAMYYLGNAGLAALNVTPLGVPAVYQPIPPRNQAPDRIAIRFADNDALGNHNKQAYAVALPVGWETSLIDLGFTFEDWFTGGVAAARHDITDFGAATLATGAGVWGFCDWQLINIHGGGVADHDYLVYGLLIEGIGVTATHRQFEIGIGDGTVGGTIVQARSAIGGTLAWYGMYHVAFDIPFQWLTGEALWIRFAQGNATHAVTESITHVCQLWRYA